MVIKGGSRTRAADLAKHLLRRDTNERAMVRELSGVAAGDLAGALAEMEAVAAGTRCRKSLYHASINVPVNEMLAPEQWMYAVNRLGHELGFDGQPRAIVEHVKEGRQHIHVVWSRIDLEAMKAISDSHNYRTHEIVARSLEQEFGHARVEGVHTGDKSQDRPTADAHADDHRQAERMGLTVAEVKADLTDAWRTTETGQGFTEAIEDKGYLLARGDKRDFVIIDAEGGLHSPRRRIEGVKAADIHARFADLDPASFPSVKEARALQAERRGEDEREGEQDGDRQGDGSATGGSSPPALTPDGPDREPEPEDRQAGAWERASRLFRDWTDRARELFVSWHRRLVMVFGNEIAAETEDESDKTEQEQEQELEQDKTVLPPVAPQAERAAEPPAPQKRGPQPFLSGEKEAGAKPTIGPTPFLSGKNANTTEAGKDGPGLDSPGVEPPEQGGGGRGD
jgi:hypothetical protein